MLFEGIEDINNKLKQRSQRRLTDIHHNHWIGINKLVSKGDGM